MQRQAVTSSNIASIGYNEEHEILEIEFKAGVTYKYAPVPKHVYDGLMSAGSHGKYFTQVIKDNYSFEKVLG